MAFLRKLMDHMLNKVLVESLANSHVFQRFAVWSHRLSKEMAEQGKEHGKVLDSHFSRFTEIAKEKSAQLRKDFEQNLKQLQEQERQQRQQQMKR